MPKKNKQSSTASGLFSGITGGKDEDDSSVSSVSTMGGANLEPSLKNLAIKSMARKPFFTKYMLICQKDHSRSPSAASFGRNSPRASMEGRPSTADVEVSPFALHKL